MAQQQSPSRTVGRDDAEGKRGNIHWVWFITGPTACGKTTIAKYLADKLGMSFVEGDDVRNNKSSRFSPSSPFCFSAFLCYLDEEENEGTTKEQQTPRKGAKTLTMKIKT